MLFFFLLCLLLHPSLFFLCVSYFPSGDGGQGRGNGDECVCVCVCVCGGGTFKLCLAVVVAFYSLLIFLPALNSFTLFLSFFFFLF